MLLYASPHSKSNEPASPVQNLNSPSCVPLLSTTSYSLPSLPPTPSTPMSSYSSSSHNHTSTTCAIYKTPSPARGRTPKTNNSSSKKGNGRYLLATPTALNSPIRRINIHSPKMKLDFDSPSTRRPLLNHENAENLESINIFFL